MFSASAISSSNSRQPVGAQTATLPTASLWTCSPAICCACSRVPPFDRYAVIPVARNVWQHVEGGSPAAEARRLIIARMKERRLRLLDPGLLDVGVEGRGCPVVRRDVVPLAALLVEPQPPPAPPPEVVPLPHPQHRAHPREAVEHDREERPVPLSPPLAGATPNPRVSAVQSRPKPRGRSTSRAPRSTSHTPSRSSAVRESARASGSWSRHASGPAVLRAHDRPDGLVGGAHGRGWPRLPTRRDRP